MPSLSDRRRTTSKVKVNGVRLTGIKNTQYSTTAKVTVNNKTENNYEYQVMTDNTDIEIKIDHGNYSLVNNSGGTINYDWL